MWRLVRNHGLDFDDKQVRGSKLQSPSRAPSSVVAAGGNILFFFHFFFLTSFLLVCRLRVHILAMRSFSHPCFVLKSSLCVRFHTLALCGHARCEFDFTSLLCVHLLPVWSWSWSYWYLCSLLGCSGWQETG